MILTGLSHFHGVEKLDHVHRHESQTCRRDTCATWQNTLYASRASHYPKDLATPSDLNRTSTEQSQVGLLLRDRFLSSRLTLTPRLTFLITCRSPEMT